MEIRKKALMGVRRRASLCTHQPSLCPGSTMPRETLSPWELSHEGRREKGFDLVMNSSVRLGLFRCSPMKPDSGLLRKTQAPGQLSWTHLPGSSKVTLGPGCSHRLRLQALSIRSVPADPVSRPVPVDPSSRPICTDPGSRSTLASGHLAVDPGIRPTRSRTQSPGLPAYGPWHQALPGSLVGIMPEGLSLPEPVYRVWKK